MKQFVLAMVLLVCLVSGGIGYQATVVYFSETMEKNISALQRDLYSAHKQTFDETMDVFLADWNRLSYAMAYLVDHEHLNSLDTSITSLRSAVALDREEEIQSALNQVHTETKNISEDILFLLKNIF